jgi:hypothetical protein
MDCSVPLSCIVSAFGNDMGNGNGLHRTGWSGQMGPLVLSHGFGLLYVS